MKIKQQSRAIDSTLLLNPSSYLHSHKNEFTSWIWTIIKKIFGDNKFLDFIKKNERDKIQTFLKIQQDMELVQEGANTNEIKKKYTNLAKSKCSESDKNYDDIKDFIDMLCTLVPYRRTLYIADNMVVLNDKYMRDNIDIISFKFGGKIKVLGYITNKIKANANEISNLFFA